jgi:hypothetical protein
MDSLRQGKSLDVQVKFLQALLFVLFQNNFAHNYARGLGGDQNTRKFVNFPKFNLQFVFRSSNER